MTDTTTTDAADQQPVKRKGWGATQAMRDFFVANPDEELTHADVMAKFGVGEVMARDMVKHLKAERLIESVHVIRSRAKGRAS